MAYNPSGFTKGFTKGFTITIVPVPRPTTDDFIEIEQEGQVQQIIDNQSPCSSTKVARDRMKAELKIANA